MKKHLIIIFILCPLILSAIILASPDRETSTLEKRTLKTRDTISSDILSSEFQADFESYLGDQFPLRDQTVSAIIRGKILLGKQDINGAYIGKSNRLFEKITDSNIKWDKIKKLVKNINSTHMKTYVMPVPSAGIQLKDTLPDNAPMYDFDGILSYLEENTDATILDLRDVLTEPDDYYLTDHHWTSKGAKKAYDLFSGRDNIYPFTTCTNDFRGTLFSKIPLADMPYDSIEIRSDLPSVDVDADGKAVDFYDMTALNTDDKYNLFQGGNHGMVTITNPANAGKKNLLIVKDSFANSFVPFAVDDYYQVAMLDPRYCLIRVPQAIEMAAADEVLFLMSMSAYVSA